MSSRLNTLVLGLALAVTACGPKKAPVAVAAPAPAALPAAADLLTRALELNGGASALQAHKTLICHGVLTMAAQGMSAPVSVYQAAPAFLYSRAEMGGVGTLEEGVVDGIAWANDPLMGPRLKEGAERATALRQSDFYFSADVASHFTSVETVGTGTLDGHPVYEVRMTPAEGAPETWLFDVRTGQAVGSRSVNSSPMGEIPITTVFSEFRTIGGVSVPMRTEIRTGVANTVLTFNEVVWDAAEFREPALPEGVAALISAEKQSLP